MSESVQQEEVETLDPNSVIIFHPGSLYLRIGRGSSFIYSIFQSYFCDQYFILLNHNAFQPRIKIPRKSFTLLQEREEVKNSNISILYQYQEMKM